MRRTAVASVAGLAVVGTLAVPAAVPMTSPPAAVPGATAFPGISALVPRPPGWAPLQPVRPRAMYSTVVASSADTAVGIWDLEADIGESEEAHPHWLVDATGRDFNDDPDVRHAEPAYSPDGTRVVYVADGDGAADRRLMEVDLGSVDRPPVPPGSPLAQGVPLASQWQPGTVDAGPAWSPDGTRIVFSRLVPDEFTETATFELRVLDRATGAVSDPFADVGLDVADHVEGDALEPAWSPDGTKILFEVDTPGSDLDEMWVLDLEGVGGIHRIGEPGEPDDAGLPGDPVPVNGAAPVWSPDGTRIAYVDPFGGRLLVAEIAGVTGEFQLVEAAGVHVLPDSLAGGAIWAPAWSPDGTEIGVAFEGGSDGVSSVGLLGFPVADAAAEPRVIVTDTQLDLAWDDISGPAYQPWADLEVDISVPPLLPGGDIWVGDTVDVVATVTNTGPSPSSGVLAYLELPGAISGFDLSTAVPDGCAGGGGFLSCSVDTLAVGQAITFTVPVTIEQPGYYIAALGAVADTPDPTVAGRTASFRVPFTPALGTERRLAFGYGYQPLGYGDRAFEDDIADALAADGSDFRLLVHEAVAGPGSVHYPSEYGPSYSPDGRRMVFDSQPHQVTGSNGSADLPWVHTLMVGDVGPGAGGASDVAPLNYPYEPGDNDYAAAWSPDGSRIAYLHAQGDSSPELALVDVVGADAPTPSRRLVAPAAWGDSPVAGAPAWSPDGRRLVVEVFDGEARGLWILHVDDDEVYPVLTDACAGGPAPCLVPVTGADPQWSPDGTRMAVAMQYTTVTERDVQGIFTLSVPAAPTQGAYVVGAAQRIAGLDPDDADGPPANAEDVDDDHLSDPTWADAGNVTFVSSRGGNGVLLRVPAAGGTQMVLRDSAPGLRFFFSSPVYQPRADVGVELSGSPEPVGRPVAVQATVTNQGPSPAWGTVVTIEVPAVAAGDAALLAWPEACAPTGATLTCTLTQEAMPVDEEVTLDLVLRITEPGTHVVEAGVTTRSVDPAQGDNADILSIDVEALPDSLAEPHLAFTRQAVQDPLDASADVADVPAQGGPVNLARLLAHESVTTADDTVLHPDESHPSYSPDGTRLVFGATPVVDGSGGEFLSSDTRLFVGDLVPDPVPGGEPALVGIEPLDYDVEEFTADSEPVWSPDGSRIAFTRETDFDFGRSVHVLDVESGDVRELTPPDIEGVETMSPSWSPGSDRLAVQVRIFGEATELWIVHLDPAGDTWFPVGTVAPSCDGNALDCLFRWPGFAPAWSPDGGRIAASDAWLYDDGPDGYSAIEVLDIPDAPSDGVYEVEDSQILVGTSPSWDDDIPEDQLAAAWHPAWSPDGTQVSFVGRATGESYDVIYTIPASGGEPEVRVAEWSDLQPGRYADPAYQAAAGDVSIAIDAPAQVAVDVPTELTATVVNAGPGPAWGVTVTFELPPGHRAIDWPAGCSVITDAVTCVLDGPVLPDGEAEVTVSVAFGEAGSQPVTGVVTTSTFDPDPSDDTDDVVIDVQPVAPATGVEPRLAFTYGVDDAQQLPSDVADVFWADGEDFRVVADERVEDPNGQFHRAAESDPSYSPDGRRMVFSAERELSEFEDEGGAPVYDIDRQAVLMVGDTRPGATGLVNVEALDYDRPDGARDIEPAWSPTGEAIAFVRDFGEGGATLALVDPEGGPVTVLDDFANDVALFDPRDPAWSPDGNYLVVEAGSESDQLWLIDVGGPELLAHRLTVQPEGCTDPDCESSLGGAMPAWSPEGTAIAFVATYLNSADEVVDGLMSVEVVDLLGTVRPPVLLAGLPRGHGDPATDDDVTDVLDPAWSLDGTSVAFVGNSGLNAFDDVIYTVPATGGTPDVMRDTVRDGLDHWFADLAYQPWADLGVTVTAPSSPVPVGAPARVEATVTNHGPSPAWGVVVDVDLPAGAGLATAVPPGCERSGTQLRCTVTGAMPVGGQETFAITLAVDAPGTPTTVATVGSRMIDPVPGNDTDSAAFTAVVPVPAPGVEPRLAFTYESDSAREVPSDVADVFWADGEQFRVIADERLVDPAGLTHWVAETDPSYSPDGRAMVFSAARSFVDDGGSDGTSYALDEATLMVGETRPGLIGLVNVEPLDYDRVAGADDVDPAWSPDGTQIAFVRHLESQVSHELALVDVATGTVRYVPGMPDFIQNPSWSPDGERIVVDATFGEGSLWVVHVAGDEAFPVDYEQPACGPEGSGCTSAIHAPSWSPDGAQVAFIDRYLVTSGSYVDGLFTVAMPTAPVGGTYQAGAAQQLVGVDPTDTEPPDEFVDLDSPAWWLDGTSVAFVGQGGGEGDASIIYTVPADGGAPVVLRDEVVPGLDHRFADLVYQPWADVGVTVTTSALEVEVGEPLDVTVTVTNHGPSPAWGVTADVELPTTADLASALPAGCVDGGTTLTCSGPEAMPVGATQVFTFTLVPTEAGSHETTAAVTSRMIDPAPGNDAAAAAFEAVETPPGLLADLGLTLALDRSTGWVGGDPFTATLVVTNAGPGSAGNVAVTITYPDVVEVPATGACLAAAPCDVGILAAGASSTIVLTLAPTAAGTGQLTATATTATQDVNPLDNAATADLEVLQPTLRLLPSIATPGEATLAYGVDFPPGAQLTLEWNRGITAWIRPVTVGADGTVRAPLLVLPGDELGERLATATSAGGPGFGDVEAPAMLVVPRTYSPPNFLTRG